MHKTIFVSIASYRDNDIQNTVDSLINNAEFPDRVYIGIFLQVDPITDTDCYVREHPNIRISTIHAKDAQGAGYARSHCQKLMNNEDFFFQVDSHMRFVKGWDSLLINMYSEVGNIKSVISTYPLPFTLPDKLHENGRVVINPYKFDIDGVLLQSSGIHAFKENQDLEQTAYISAGMLFGPGIMVKDVPADPYIEFTGEEITTAIRLWTHGYNVYIPNKVVAYHNYDVNTGRPRIWHDKVAHDKVHLKSRARVLHLCRTKSNFTDDCLFEIDKYSLGKVRTFESFEEFTKIDFKNGLYNNKKI